SVTLLEFLPRAAVAGIVAPDLLARRRARGRGGGPRRGGGGRRRRAPEAVVRHLAAALARVGPRRDRRQLHRRVAHHLHLEEALHDGGLGPLHHVLEEVERFLLVLGERVALAVPAQADAFLQVVDRQQVILPLPVDDDHHLVALER